MGPDLIGAVLEGRYKVVERVAEGAMGIVYRGERVKLGRAVAIKFLHAWNADDAAARKRFEVEARAMARLEHPNCAAVIDVGEYDGAPYVVMDFVRGTTLRDVLDEGPIDPARAADIARQVLSGLAHAHELGIVHRDIKPANIMLSDKVGIGEMVKILDFGLAQLRGTSGSLTVGIAIGTPSYMSPEQIGGDAVDARTDLYACGVLLFEMLTGDKPFVADEPLDVLRMHREARPPRASERVPAEMREEIVPFDDVILRSLEKKADDRFLSAAEVVVAIERALRSREQIREARAAGTLPRSPSRIENARAGGGAATAPRGGISHLATQSGGRAEPLVRDVGPVIDAAGTASTRHSEAFSDAAPRGADASGATARDAGGSARGAGGSAREGGGSAREGGGSARAAEASAREGGASARAAEASAREGGGSAREGGGSARDAGGSARDMGASAGDGAASVRDAGVSARDGGASARDGGASVRDAGGSARDMGALAGDGAASVRDADAALVTGLGASTRGAQASLPAAQIVEREGQQAVARRASGVDPAKRRALIGVALGVGALAAIGVIAAVASGGHRAAVIDAAPAIAIAAPDAQDPSDDVVTRARTMVANGDSDGAIHLLDAARRTYPDRAVISFELGRLYFARLWWRDGLDAFRAAIRADPGFRTDPDLIKTVLRGFNTTPDTDEGMARFLRNDIGDAAIPYLQETAQSHPSEKIRARAAALLERYR